MNFISNHNTDARKNNTYAQAPQPFLRSFGNVSNIIHQIPVNATCYHPSLFVPHFPNSIQYFNSSALSHSTAHSIQPYEKSFVKGVEEDFGIVVLSS